MTKPAARTGVLRTSALSGGGRTRFSWKPDTAARAALAADLGLLDLPALHLSGEITPAGRRDLWLQGQLTATVVQPCIVTLEPVTTKIAEPVERRYVEDFVQPEGDEVEVPEDDSLEPLPQVIDLAEVAAEALTLALPLYPRAPGAELGTVVHAGDGVAPLRDADLRPFAGLARLAGRVVPPADGEGNGG